MLPDHAGAVSLAHLSRCLLASSFSISRLVSATPLPGATSAPASALGPRLDSLPRVAPTSIALCRTRTSLPARYTILSVRLTTEWLRASRSVRGKSKPLSTCAPRPRLAVHEDTPGPLFLLLGKMHHLCSGRSAPAHPLRWQFCRAPITVLHKRVHLRKRGRARAGSSTRPSISATNSWPLAQ